MVKARIFIFLFKFLITIFNDYINTSEINVYYLRFILNYFFIKNLVYTRIIIIFKQNFYFASKMFFYEIYSIHNIGYNLIIEMICLESNILYSSYFKNSIYLMPYFYFNYLIYSLVNN